MNVSAQVDTDLPLVLKQYAELARKTPGEVLSKKGGDFAFTLAGKLRALSPAKGSIRASRLAALKAGAGLKVRERVRESILQKFGAHTAIGSSQVRFFRGRKSVTEVTRKGRKLNLQALMIQRELAVRESGRGFLAVSSRYPRRLQRDQTARSRFGPDISEAKLTGTGDGAAAEFQWGQGSELSQSAAHGLLTPRGKAATASALRDLRVDTLAYLARKNAEAARRAGLAMT